MWVPIFTITFVFLLLGQASESSICGECLCVPPRMLCSGDRVVQMPPLSKKMRYSFTSLVIAHTRVRNIPIDIFPNLRVIKLENNVLINCESIRQFTIKRPILNILGDCAYLGTDTNPNKLGTTPLAMDITSTIRTILPQNEPGVGGFGSVINIILVSCVVFLLGVIGIWCVIRCRRFCQAFRRSYSAARTHSWVAGIRNAHALTPSHPSTSATSVTSLGDTSSMQGSDDGRPALQPSTSTNIQPPEGEGVEEDNSTPLNTLECASECSAFQTPSLNPPTRPEGETLQVVVALNPLSPVTLENPKQDPADARPVAKKRQACVEGPQTRSKRRKP